MKSKAEIRREVEKKASEFTARDLFSSPYFEEMLQATVTSVCEKLGRIPKLTCICDEENPLTAATNGPNIYLNTQGSLIKDMDTNWKMYVSNIGHVVHETGHVLFTDFAHQNKMLAGWLNDPVFSFYPKMPGIPGAEDVKEAMTANPMMRALYAGSMQSIANILEDAYVENRLRDNFSGLATAGLSLVNEEMYRQAQELKEHISAVFEGKIFPLQLAESILLTSYVAEKPLKDGGLTEKERRLLNAVIAVLEDVKPVTNALCFEQDGEKRCELFNILFVKLFPLMPRPMEQSSGGNGGEDDKNEQDGQCEESNENASDFSKEEAKYFADEINAFCRASGKSLAPEGDTSSIKQGKCDDSDEKEKAELLSRSESSLSRELSRAVKEAAKEAVLSEDEQRHAADLRKEAREIEGEIEKITKFSDFSGYRLKRGRPDKEGYQRTFAEVQKSSKNLTRKISNILKDRETESVEGGFLMGQRFNASDVVNHDGKYFSRQVIPDGKPDVAFGILIDESGSMACREKFVKARRAAILLEDALRNLDIPLIIAGHTEEGGGDCTLHSYVDFDTNDGKDPYRLSGITAQGGNIDGAAITYMGEKLMKRPEKIKVLIVISDGLPAGCSFYDHNANEDTKKAIEHYRRKGIDVFGAVVDSFEKVSSLYGDKYCFDCREDLELEKQLIRLIKRYVLMKG